MGVKGLFLLALVVVGCSHGGSTARLEAAGSEAARPDGTRIVEYLEGLPNVADRQAYVAANVEAVQRIAESKDKTLMERFKKAMSSP